MKWLLLLSIVAVASVASVASVTEWTKSALVYQIYPRSFKDSNGDGIGDLNGITSKLRYLRDTGVGAIWLSPIYLSPMYDFGYDITDYTKIAPEYGTMADFDNLMKEAKRLGVRVVLDFVPNHTSNESEWFVKSARREKGYENYYVWADGKKDPANASNTIPPSNWVSIFRKSAWEWSEVRQQYYLHQFVIGQPDLNYRDNAVQKEMENVLRFWLEKGVSGFRIDAINVMYEVDPAKHGGVFPDEPLSGKPGMSPDDYNYLDHPYTMDQNETYDVVYNWRDVLNEYEKLHGEDKIMMTESYTDLDLVMKYYGSNDRDGSIPFNFEFLGGINNKTNAPQMKAVIDKWMNKMPAGRTANWVNGNHDQSRLASRHGTDRVDAMNMLALLLPGVTLTYQGEEIGMTDGYVNWKDTKDPQACNTDDPINFYKVSRDPNRTPYHWDDTENAGFSSTNQTWLPVATNYKELNLAAQQKARKSHYRFYKDVVSIKKTLAVKSGELNTVAVSDNVLVLTRHLRNSVAVGVVNLGESQVLNLSTIPNMPSRLLVVASGVDSTLEKGTRVQADSINMSGHSAIVLYSI